MLDWLSQAGEIGHSARLVGGSATRHTAMGPVSQSPRGGGGGGGGGEGSRGFLTSLG